MQTHERNCKGGVWYEVFNEKQKIMAELQTQSQPTPSIHPLANRPSPTQAPSPATAPVPPSPTPASTPATVPIQAHSYFPTNPSTGSSSAPPPGPAPTQGPTQTQVPTQGPTHVLTLAPAQSQGQPRNAGFLSFISQGQIPSDMAPLPRLKPIGRMAPRAPASQGPQAPKVNRAPGDPQGANGRTRNAAMGELHIV